MKESHVQKLVKVFIFLYINFDGNSLKNCDVISLPAKIDVTTFICCGGIPVTKYLIIIFFKAFYLYLKRFSYKSSEI